MERCIRCCLPAGKFNVVLNSNGTCNYCEFFEKNAGLILNIGGRDKMLANRFEALRGKYEYDAAVGLSGGKDSTYVALKLVSKYKLKILAVTYDNGFLTDYAKNSIANTVSRLGIDHIYYKPKWEAFKLYYQATVKKLFDPCIACGLGGYFLAIKACFERNIPLFVHGRTPFQMYRNFYAGSNDLFLSFMKLNLMEHSFKNLAPVYNLANESVRKLINTIADDPQVAKEISGEFLLSPGKLSEKFVPEFLAFFLFEDYDEEKVKAEVEEAIGWERPAGDNLLGHYDCALHDAAGYMFKALNGVDVIEPDVAVMVRLGKLGIEKVNEVIECNQPSNNNLQKSLDALFALCGINQENMNNTLHVLRQANVSKFESR
jgi:hypothetical protein